MSWTLSGQDTFNRANAALDGATGSDSVTVWAGSHAAAPKVVSNQCVGDAGVSSFTSAKDVTIGDIADQKASVKWISGDGGPMVRMTASAKGGYNAYVASDGSLTLFRWSNAGGSTSIGSIGGAGTVVTTDIVGISAIGDSLQCLVNDAPVGSPVTDATFATGARGLIVHETCVVDDWKGYVPEAASARSAALINGTLIN